MELDSDCSKTRVETFKPDVCKQCKSCICKPCLRAAHFLQLDMVFEAMEKLNRMLIPEIEKELAEMEAKFKSL